MSETYIISLGDEQRGKFTVAGSYAWRDEDDAWHPIMYSINAKINADAYVEMVYDPRIGHYLQTEYSGLHAEKFLPMERDEFHKYLHLKARALRFSVEARLDSDG